MTAALVLALVAVAGEPSAPGLPERQILFGADVQDECPVAIRDLFFEVARRLEDCLRSRRMFRRSSPTFLP